MNKRIVFGIVVVLLAIFAWIYLSKEKDPTPILSDLSDSVTHLENTEDKKEQGSGVEGDGLDGASIVIDQTPKSEQPNLTALSSVPSGVPDKIRGDFEKKIELLKVNGLDFERWYEVGVYRKQFGDYSGASEVWKYALEIRPKSSQVLSALGNLYTFYLKDNKLAEDFYLRAVQNSPSFLQYRIQLADFYADILGDNNKAISQLKEAKMEAERQGLKDVATSIQGRINELAN